MTGALGILYLASLAGLTFGILAAVASAAIYPWLSRRLRSVHPAARSSWLLVFAAGPVGTAVLLTVVCFVPSVLGAMGLMVDHCLTHDDHHAHLCVVHPPDAVGGGVGTLLIGLVLLCGLAGAAAKVRAWVRGRQLLRLLPMASTNGPADDVRLLDSRTPVSFSAGILRPAVYVSSGLMAAAPPGVISVILEHERAHVRRRDGLRKLLASIFGFAHLPATRARVLADLSLACEEACDAEAAERSGDRLRVADAILAAERVLAAGSPPGLYASAFGGSNVAARVEALLEPPTARPRLKRMWLIAGTAAVLAVSEPLHHVTETLLGLLVG